VRVFCFLAGLLPDQIVYLASACNYDASEKEYVEWWTHGDFHMYGYISHLAIFCRLALDLGHQILALDWNLQHGIRGGGLGRLFCFFLFLFIQLYCFVITKNVSL